MQEKVAKKKGFYLLIIFRDNTLLVVLKKQIRFVRSVFVAEYGS